jgi:membrane protease YdiL (CAAX protease family)
MSLIMSLPLIFGEEYGWRGWLLENLSQDRGRLVGAIGTGLVWAIWHGPVIYGLARANGLPGPELLTGIQMAAIFVFSFAFAGLYFQSGSIIPPWSCTTYGTTTTPWCWVTFTINSTVGSTAI